ncbi:MAG TPA: hypothetical protein VF128_11675 [Gemmatimonadaceae bacterium]
MKVFSYRVGWAKSGGGQQTTVAGDIQVGNPVRRQANLHLRGTSLVYLGDSLD